MASILTFLHGCTRRNAIAEVGRLARRPGIGFGLVVVLSLVFAVVAEAQTKEGGSGPTLTIASSHATLVKGEEVTFTITADSAPTTDILVYVQVQVTVREQSYVSKQGYDGVLGSGRADA